MRGGDGKREDLLRASFDNADFIGADLRFGDDDVLDLGDVRADEAVLRRGDDDADGLAVDDGDAVVKTLGDDEAFDARLADGVGGERRDGGLRAGFGVGGGIGVGKRRLQNIQRLILGLLAGQAGIGEILGKLRDGAGGCGGIFFGLQGPFVVGKALGVGQRLRALCGQGGVFLGGRRGERRAGVVGIEIPAVAPV